MTSKSPDSGGVAKPKHFASRKTRDVPKPAPKREKAVPRRSSTAKGAPVSDQQRHNYVEVAAYYIAERRGFQGGSALEDWAEAEREVERMLGDRRFSR